MKSCLFVMLTFLVGQSDRDPAFESGFTADRQAVYECLTSDDPRPSNSEMCGIDLTSTKTGVTPGVTPFEMVNPAETADSTSSAGEPPIAEDPPSHRLVCCVDGGFCNTFVNVCPQGMATVPCPCSFPAVAKDWE